MIAIQIGREFSSKNATPTTTKCWRIPTSTFVHINSPIPDHAWMSLKALDAGKHVMCTVPMATTIEECRRSSRRSKQTGLKYMMAETVVYSREFLFIKEMYERGELGKIQHLAASHPQDMDGWPDYWEKMIPMHYATHVVSPCLGTDECFGRIRSVVSVRARCETTSPRNPAIVRRRAVTSS
jgi:predicted dehydrogenase